MDDDKRNGVDEDAAVSSLLRAHATRHRASQGLRSSVATQLALADAARDTKERASSRIWWGSVASWGARWRPAGAGFIVGVALTLAAMVLLRQIPSPAPIEADLVALHVHALRAGSLVDVVSSDRHTVKPWFQGRIDYAPPVPDLTDEGFLLLGGRVAPLRGQDTAVLVYMRRQHVVEVLVQPGQRTLAPRSTVRRGFNIVHDAQGAMTLWAISDLDAHELEAFVRLWRQRTAPG